MESALLRPRGGGFKDVRGVEGLGLRVEVVRFFSGFFAGLQGLMRAVKRAGEKRLKHTKLQRDLGLECQTAVCPARSVSQCTK